MVKKERNKGVEREGQRRVLEKKRGSCCGTTFVYYSMMCK